MWSDASNWSTGTVPGFTSPYNAVIGIGNFPGLANHTVLLDHQGAGAMAYEDLYITSGMTLDANNRELGTLTGFTSITGANSRLILRPGPGGNFHDMTSARMLVGTGAQFDMRLGSRLRAGAVVSTGNFGGRGAVYLQGFPGVNYAFRNDGTITGLDAGGLTFLQEFAARMDLDGGLNAGQLNMTAPFSQLTFQGDALTDSFSGTVTMGSGSLLDMDMALGWTADAVSTFNVSSSIVGAAAQIDGGHFTFGGDLNIGGSQGHLRLLADSTFTSTADVFLGTNDRLEFDGSATVQGGLYNLSQGARIDFDGQTQIGGGTFNLVGSTPAQGAVNFNGATTWSGVTTINGFARQVGDATVSTPTTINATVLDMDGNGDTAWTINHALTVNTQAVEHLATQFDGTINMNVGAVGRLTVNLPGPSPSWTMNGTMNLAGFAALTTTRVAGSRMIVTGDLNMGAGLAQITADTALQGADVSINAAGTLRMRGATTVDIDTDFSGAGVLHNGLGGTMTLDSGVSLGDVGLRNSGVLRVGGDGPGIAGMDRVTFTPESVWEVGIGGYAALQHDLVTLTGTSGAALGGALSVSLLDLGVGFTPQVGDEFLILASLQGGNTGVFINDPVTQAGALTYEWSVIYSPHHVYLRLDSIVPAPGGVALLGLAGLLAARRRRA